MKGHGTARYPGTCVSIRADGANLLDSYPEVVWESGGIALSQLKLITGLTAPTLQNWVNRGFTYPPEQRKYSKDKVARILIINALRDALPLEKIAALLSYVNGKLLDRSDDVIDDAAMYSYFCRMLTALGEKPLDDELLRLTADRMVDMQPETSAAKVKRALCAMVLAYRCSELRRQAIDAIDKLLDGSVEIL